MRRRSASMVVISACGAAAPAIPALGQQFVNPGFDSGTLSGWTVQATPNGQTLTSTVEMTDIDGTGELGATPAAKFRVGQVNAVPGAQAGIEVAQTLPLTQGVTYTVSLNWATTRDSGGLNSEGGVFTLFVQSNDLATHSAGPTSETSPQFGFLEGLYTPATSGPHRVGVRITRPLTIPTTLMLFQRIDNVSISVAVLGACCFPDGSCGARTQALCGVQGGTYRGNGVPCSAAACEDPPLGACCFADGSCTLTWQGACEAAIGVYAGDATKCASTDCPRYLISPPPNNAQSAPGASVFLDLTPNRAIYVTRLDYYPLVAAGGAASVQVWTYPGSYQGHDTAAAGWTFRETVHTVSAGPDALAPLSLAAPIAIESGQTVGVAVIAQGGGLGYRGTDLAPPDTVFADGILLLSSDRVRTAPWGGTLETPRAWSGRVFYGLGTICYPNCDGSTAQPILNVADFTCFLQRFAQGSHYTNCDHSTSEPVLNVADFTCFLQAMATGCR